MEAQVAASLQAEDKGERFSVVNAASAPLDPIRPKRMQLLISGLLGGFVVGLILVITWEFIAGPIHGEGAVARLMDCPPLAVIPILAPGMAVPILERARRFLRLPSKRSGVLRSGVE